MFKFLVNISIQISLNILFHDKINSISIKGECHIFFELTNNLRKRLDGLNDIVYIIFMVSLNWFLYLPFILISLLYKEHIMDIGVFCNFYNYSNTLSNILFAVVLLPLFHTCIQAIIIRLLFRINLTKKQVLFLGTAIFSLFHCYSIFCIIQLVVPSFILFYSYIYYKNKQIPSFSIVLSISIISSLITYLEQV